MRRLHVFEWEDQPWLPRAFRIYLTELLQHQVGELYRPALPVLVSWLTACGCRDLVDLGSGAGGPWPVLVPALAERGVPVRVTLTDRFPSSAGPLPREIARHPLPVDLRNLPEELSGCLTLFTSFHHLKPPQAQALLRRAAEDLVPIALFEFTERRWSRLLGMLPSPLLVWAQTPAIRPFSWGRLFWTYLLPVVPALYLWDGAVSHLRSYSVEELQGMTAPLASPDYSWEVGSLSHPTQDVTITYLLGRSPRDPCATQSA